MSEQVHTPRTAPRWARRNLLVSDWDRIERALRNHAKECDNFANELNQKYGHPCPAADTMREEAAESYRLARDLDITAIKELLS